MKCLLLQEYEVFAHNLDHMINDFKNYMSYGAKSVMAGPYGYHPNRCVYIIPETNKWYLWLKIMNIGRDHIFEKQVLEARGWI